MSEATSEQAGGKVFVDVELADGSVKTIEGRHNADGTDYFELPPDMAITAIRWKPRAPFALDDVAREHQLRLATYIEERLAEIIGNELPKAIWREVDQFFIGLRREGQT